jgi:hypothetical protein
MALFDEPMRTMYLLREQSDRHVRKARFDRSVETCNLRDHEEAVHISIEAPDLLGGLGRTNDGEYAAMIGSARDVMRNRRRRTKRRELERE